MICFQRYIYTATVFHAAGAPLFAPPPRVARYAATPVRAFTTTIIFSDTAAAWGEEFSIFEAQKDIFRHDIERLLPPRRHAMLFRALYDIFLFAFTIYVLCRGYFLSCLSGIHAELMALRPLFFRPAQRDARHFQRSLSFIARRRSRHYDDALPCHARPSFLHARAPCHARHAVRLREKMRCLSLCRRDELEIDMRWKRRCLFFTILPPAQSMLFFHAPPEIEERAAYAARRWVCCRDRVSIREIWHWGGDELLPPPRDIWGGEDDIAEVAFAFLSSLHSPSYIFSPRCCCCAPCARLLRDDIRARFSSANQEAAPAAIIACQPLFFCAKKIFSPFSHDVAFLVFAFCFSDIDKEAYYDMPRVFSCRPRVFRAMKKILLWWHTDEDMPPAAFRHAREKMPPCAPYAWWRAPPLYCRRRLWKIMIWNQPPLFYAARKIKIYAAAPPVWCAIILPLCRHERYIFSYDIRGAIRLLFFFSHAFWYIEMIRHYYYYFLTYDGDICAICRLIFHAAIFSALRERGRCEVRYIYDFAARAAFFCWRLPPLFRHALLLILWVIRPPYAIIAAVLHYDAFLWRCFSPKICRLRWC